MGKCCSKGSKEKTTELNDDNVLAHPDDGINATGIEDKSDLKRQNIDSIERAKVYQMIIEAITNNKGLVTINDIEVYLTDKYRHFAPNSFKRRGIIARIIAEEFIRSNIAVKSTKYCS